MKIKNYTDPNFSQHMTEDACSLFTFCFFSSPEIACKRHTGILTDMYPSATQNAKRTVVALSLVEASALNQRQEGVYQGCVCSSPGGNFMLQPDFFPDLVGGNYRHKFLVMFFLSCCTENRRKF